MIINIENKTNYEVFEDKVFVEIAKNVLKIENQPSRYVVFSVFIVDENEIASLNKEYREKDRPTDVITFRLVDTKPCVQLTKQNYPMDFDFAGGGIYVGEIFICATVAERQASEFGNTTQREIAELFVHGMLHMLGHDHHEPQETELMRGQEQAMFPILDKLVK